MVKISTVETMSLDGGNPALDLVNSGYAVVPGETVERLHAYADLLTLARRHQFLDPEAQRLLAQEAFHHPKAAAVALEEVREARTAMYEIFNLLAAAPGSAVDGAVLRRFNSFLPDALAHRRVTVSGMQLTGGWQAEPRDLHQPLRQYIWAAYELLTGPAQAFIKKCGRCAWLFVDETKNHRRKWCDMQVCGASAKAKRYYQNRKQTGLVPATGALNQPGRDTPHQTE